jgi:integrase
MRAGDPYEGPIPRRSARPILVDAAQERRRWAVLLTEEGSAPQRLDAVSDYLGDCATAPWNTQEARARDLALFAGFCVSRDPEMDWREINGRGLGAFVQALLTTPSGTPFSANVRTISDVRSAETVRRILSSVRGFYRWAHASELVTKHRLDVVTSFRGPRTSERRSADRLTRSEVLSLLEAVAQEADNACIVAFLHGMGLRASGLLGLRFDDVHIDPTVASTFGCEWPSGGPHHPHLHVRRRPETELPSRVAAKSSDYVIPVPSDAIALYRAYLSERLDRLGVHDASPFVFVSLRGRHAGKPLTRNALNKRFARLSTADALSSGRSVHPHLLRHTFASEIGEGMNVAGEDVSRTVLQALLGHRSPRSQDVYRHPRNSEIVAAVEALRAHREKSA